MDISVAEEVERASFAFYRAGEIERISVKHLRNPILLDSLGRPSPGGLYDPALGPVDKHASCSTCGLSATQCPGHLGHIRLSAPVFNPLLITTLFKLLRLKCFSCHRFRMHHSRVERYWARLVLLDMGCVVEALEVAMPRTHNLDETEGVSGKKAEDHPSNEYTADSLQNSAASSAELRERIACFKAKVPRREGRKIANVAEAWREAMANFVQHMPARKCENCGAISPTLRKEGVKFFQGALSEKDRKANAIINRGFPSVFDDSGKDTIAVQELTAIQLRAVGKSTMAFCKEASHAPSEKKHKKKDASASHFLSPIAVEGHLRLLWAEERDVLDEMFGSITPSGRSSSPDMFFIQVMAVPPSRFRPPARIGDLTFEHPQNVSFAKILQADSYLLQTVGVSAPGVTDSNHQNVVDIAHVYEAYVQLQLAVNNVIDSTKGPASSMSGVKSADEANGIRQILEKKEGLFRKNMMGKRVNYAARSVISPDPYIATNEIGLPHYFVTRLTYPEGVTQHNVDHLRRCVINGPHKHPGANFIEFEDGHRIDLSTRNEMQRMGLAKQLMTKNQVDGTEVRSRNKRVFRHANDGDILLVNRQPTLHKPSMMAHRLRVVRGSGRNDKTIRMHYANCNTYNADFDGDEINVHLPQSEPARAEAYNIADTDHQYTVPTSGRPIRGLIQDNVGTGVLLTMKDTFLSRDMFMQLVFVAVGDAGHGRIRLPPPAIMKPKPQWTGKQVISSVLTHLSTSMKLPPLNLEAGSKISASAWIGCPEEARVIIRQGDLCTGVLDKNAFGASEHGLVHAWFEVYGPTAAGQLLTILCRLFMHYLQYAGFTCGIDDLVINAAADKRRLKTLKGTTVAGVLAAQRLLKALEGQEQNPADEGECGSAENVASVQKELKQGMERVGIDQCAPLLDSFVKQHIAPITSKVMRSCLEAEDGPLKRFPANNMTLMTTSGAKGSVVNASQISCLLGQQELEGRRVPIMPSGKTLPCFDAFNPEPRAGGFIGDRFLTGIHPQEYYFHCMAGREGLVDTAVKTSRSGYLQRCVIKSLESLQVNYDGTVRDGDGTVVQFIYGEDALDVTKASFVSRFSFLLENLHNREGIDEQEVSTKITTESNLAWSKTAVKDPSFPEWWASNIGRDLASCSPKFHDALSQYLHSDPFKMLSNQHRSFSKRTASRALLQRYQRALAEPGEVVGVLAAQSIGEPSTQMTLNTFHQAGVGAANVTLGIPRLREIMMTASEHISTPAMTLALQQGRTRPDAESLARKLARVHLADVVDQIVITEQVESAQTAERTRLYQVKLILSESIDGLWHGISYKRIVAAVKDGFFTRLCGIIKKELKAQGRDGGDLAVVWSKSRSRGARHEEGIASVEDDSGRRKRGSDDAMAEEDDEDFGKQLSKSRGRRSVSYDEPDEKEEEITKHTRREDDALSSADDDGRGDDIVSIDEIIRDDEEADYTAVKKSVVKAKRDHKQTQAFDNDASDLDDQPRYIARTGESDADQGGDEVKSAVDQDKAKGLKSLALSMCGKEEVPVVIDPHCKWIEIRSIKVPVQAKRLAMVALVEQASAMALVQETPGIKKCHIIQSPSSRDAVVIQTEGVNLGVLWKYSNIINLAHVDSNDIAAILKFYGVEAARAAIVKEIRGVFQVYGIVVDWRHLSLIADYMTLGGAFTPFSRMGMAKNPSPMLKMSFETTTQFLTDAALTGDFDDLSTPASRIVVGKVAPGGTGCFELRFSR